MSAWFAFPATLYGSKQALIAADILKVERWEAVGLIAGLYTWSVDNADRNGLLENVSASVLADALGYPKKKAAALVKALAEAGIIQVLEERTILVKDWYEIGGRLADVREKGAEKKRKQRAASYARPKDVPRDVPGDVTETSRANINNNNNNNNNNISSDDDMCNGGEAANAHACEEIAEAATCAENVQVATPAQKPKVKAIRHKYGEYHNVLLTDEDYAKLQAEFPTEYEALIDRLSAYMASTGRAYKNHLATMRNWARRDLEKGVARSSPIPQAREAPPVYRQQTKAEELDDFYHMAAEWAAEASGGNDE